MKPLHNTDCQKIQSLEQEKQKVWEQIGKETLQAAILKVGIAGSAPTEEQNLDEKLKKQKAEWIAQKTC